MAGDWIKMRTDLYRDPKVCLIADWLGNPDGELARFVSTSLLRDMTVTRNVTRNAAVGALLSVWGVLRHQGERHDDDLVVTGATLNTIDDISDIVGFGEAMAGVGWVIDTDSALVFPKFFGEMNSDPHEKAKRKSAERQARYRQRKRDANSDVTGDVTGDVTVTDREEKSKSKSKSKSTKKTIDPASAGSQSSSKRTATADIDTVVDHYKKLHPRSKPGGKERKLISARLKEGYSAKDLTEAIDGMHNCPHNNGANDSGQKYLSLELAMRNSSKVTQYLDAKTSAEHKDEIPF